MPIREHHPFYCSDEIEIWEVTTMDFQSDPESNIHHQRITRHATESQSSLTMLSWGNVEEVLAVIQFSPIKTEADGATPVKQTCQICIKQDIHVGIGNSLWPSSVVLSR